MEAEAERHVAGLLRCLAIDAAGDHNSTDTPRRYARMLVREVFAGRYAPRPALTDFPNARKLDELYAVGPITIRSACAHHLVPIIGEAWIGVIPEERVIGLSKFSRLAQWVMSRPQIQEEAIVMLADEIEAAIAPAGLAVVMRAKHLCCAWRGVRDGGQMMTTSVMRGVLRTDSTARREFLSLVAGQGHG